MLSIKKCLVLVFALSLLMAGMPSLAKADCLMMKSRSDMNMGDMKDCPKMSKYTQSEKGACCGDVSCAVQCSTAANASINGFVSHSLAIPLLAVKEAFYPASDSLTFSWQGNQERPPKQLS